MECSSAATKSGETPKDETQDFDHPYSYIYSGYINSHPHGPNGIAATMLHEWVHQSIINFVWQRGWKNSEYYALFWGPSSFTNYTLGGAVADNASELFAYTVEYKAFPGETPSAVIK